MQKLIYALLIFTILSCNTTKKAHFNKEYIDYYSGNLRVEIPEAYELINVMMAISKVGQIDSNMIEMKTDYHKQVMEHFLTYQNHPQIKKINKKLKKPEHWKSYIYYLVYRMNALGYSIDDKDKLHYSAIIPQTKFFLLLRNPLDVNKKRINDFIIKSDFRDFYVSHKNFYDSLTNIYKTYVPIDKMTFWLSEKFPDISYDSYKIVISPLVGGTHYTKRYNDNNFSQTIMSVNAAYLNNKNNENVTEMNMSRIVFTEIDHNFVNPTSDIYKDEIDISFKNLNFWVNESLSSEAYDSPYRTFNEYMTWSLFSLYCNDNYPPEDAEIAIGYMENNMVKGRDFIKFKEFNRELMKIYTENPEIKVEELYSKILQWSNNEQQLHKTKNN